jgi:hypothetical protein
MSKLVTYLGIAFALFVTISMIRLFDYNIDTSGTFFAVAMVVLPLSATAALIIHHLQNK